MQRPLLKWLIAFSSGLITAYYLPSTELIIIILGIIILILALVILIIEVKGKAHFLILIFIFLIAFFYLQVEELAWDGANLKRVLGRKVEFSGVIDKVSSGKYNTSYIIKELKAVEFKQEYDYKIKLVLWNQTKSLARGDKIQFTTKLKLPAVQKNPGGFSYRKYLQKNGVYAVGEVEKSNVVKINSSKNIFINLANKSRFIIKKKIEKYFKGVNQQIIEALLLGIKNSIAPEVNQLFNQLGVSHLLVISGFHVGVLSYLFYLVINYFRFSKWFNLILITLFLTFYLIIINWQLPALRATLLIILIILARNLNRKVDLYNLLSGIALSILIINPWNLFLISFQLSFGAVVAISYLNPVLRDYLLFLNRKVAEMISTTLAVQIGLLPILIYYFNQLSLLAIVANLVLMPLISIVLILALSFIGLSLINVYCAKFIVVLIELLVAISLKVVVFLTSNFDSIIILKRPSLVLIAAYYLLIFYLARIIKKKEIPYSKDIIKQSVIISLIIIFLVIFRFENNEDLEIIFLAVGLGDCTYINTPTDENILIDGGSKGEKAIRLLKQQGINKLDIIFISHFHQDHVGGIIKVIKKFNVDKICYPLTENNDLQRELKRIIQSENSKTDLLILKKGDKIKIDELEFLALSPSIPLLKDSKLNNNSLVLKATYRQFELLLTGDIEKSAEQKLVNSHFNLDVDVLKLAHHGSNTSNTKLFLRRTDPDLSITSVGINNYGLPDNKVLKRVKKKGINNLRTDEKGAIILQTDGEKYWYRTFLD